jgi:spermidine synthase
LRPQELDALWAKLESGPCARLLSGAETSWIALFKAAGNRDAADMVKWARSILESEKAIQPEALRFLIVSGMTGYLMQGDREGSSRLWSRYKSTLFGSGQPDLLFRMLAADSAKPH